MYRSRSVFLWPSCIITRLNCRSRVSVTSGTRPTIPSACFFRLAEGGRLVEGRVLKQVDSAFAGGHIILLLVQVGLSAHAASAFAGAAATYGFTIFFGSTTRSNSASVTKPNFNAATFNVRSLSIA